MVISERIKNQYFAGDNEQGFIRIAQTNVPVKPKRNGQPWSADEHDRFLSALEAFPSGPWKIIASYVGTRTTRQTMTHAQKYREKIARMKRAMKERTAIALVVRPQMHYVGSVLPPLPVLEMHSPVSPNMFPALHPRHLYHHQYHQHHPFALPSMHELVDHTTTFVPPSDGVPHDLPAPTTSECSGGFSSTIATALPHLDVDHGVLHSFADMYEPIEILDDAWHHAALANDSSEDSVTVALC